MNIAKNGGVIINNLILILIKDLAKFMLKMKMG